MLCVALRGKNWTKLIIASLPRHPADEFQAFLNFATCVSAVVSERWTVSMCCQPLSLASGAVHRASSSRSACSIAYKALNTEHRLYYTLFCSWIAEYILKVMLQPHPAYLRLSRPVDSGIYPDDRGVIVDGQFFSSIIYLRLYYFDWSFGWGL